MFLRDAWMVENSLCRILVLKVFLAVQLLLLLLATAAFFVHSTATTSAVLLVFHLRFNFLEDVFHTLVLCLDFDNIVVFVFLIIVNHGFRFNGFRNRFSLNGGFGLKSWCGLFQRF